MEIRQGKPGRNEPNQKPKRKLIGGPRKPEATRTTLNAVANDVPLFISASDFWHKVYVEYRRLRRKRHDLGHLHYMSKNQVSKAEFVRLDKLHRDTWASKRLWELSLGMAMFEENVAHRKQRQAKIKRKYAEDKWNDFLRDVQEESKIRTSPMDLSYTKKQLESLEQKLKLQAVENVKHRLAEKWRIEHGLNESSERSISHPVCGPGREETEDLNEDTQQTGSPAGSQGSEH